MQETCRQLQEEEILMISSIYCKEGEFLAYDVDTASTRACLSAGTTGTTGCTCEEACSAGDSLCRAKAPLDKETVCIHIKLQVHEAHSLDLGVTVQCILPKLYPRLESPNITISSRHMPTDYLIELNCRISLHCKTFIPEPCVFDVLEWIKAELVKLESPDTPELSWEPVKAPITLTMGMGNLCM
jgi:hypothetical protein